MILLRSEGICQPPPSRLAAICTLLLYLTGCFTAELAKRGRRPSFALDAAYRLLRSPAYDFILVFGQPL
jgi:hypothetical protein